MSVSSLPPCPICGSPPREQFTVKFFQALKCGNPACGHIYALGAPAMHGVQTHLDAQEECDFYRARDRALVAYLTREGFFAQGMKILDFGSGVGHMPMAIREAHPTASITCVEADPATRTWLREHDLKTVASLDEAPRDSDCLMFMEVLEHLDDPVGMLRTLRTHLRPGGTMFLTTPCGETRGGKRDLQAYDTPEHVQFFTESSLRLTLSKAGFQHVDLRVVNEIYPKGEGLRYPVSLLKDLMRPVRARLFGFYHYTGFIR